VADDIRICKFGAIILNDPNHQSLPIRSLMSYTQSTGWQISTLLIWEAVRSLRLISTYKWTSLWCVSWKQLLQEMSLITNKIPGHTSFREQCTKMLEGYKQKVPF